MIFRYRNFIYDGADNREYAYDSNGNVTRDDNRGISSIEYNALGLPSRISVGSGSSIEYIYSADGTKLGSRYTEGRAASYALEAKQQEQSAQPYAYISEDYDYIGCYEFRNRNLFRVNTPYGYYLAGEFTPYMRDYQGNNRNEAGYYAYGLPTSDSDVKSYDPYLYGDKMLYTLKGLNIYDLLARTYAPDIARFMQPDPKAGDYHWLSPYAYCGGDPINFVDPDGQVLYTTYNGVNYSWEYRNGKWGFYNSSGNLFDGDDSFITNLASSLETLLSGETGKSLVTELVNSKKFIKLKDGSKLKGDIKTGANDDLTNIYMNYNDPVGAMTTEGMDFNSTMNLAHELAHVQLGKKYDEQWDLTADGSEISLGQVDKSELYATHVENKIRAEQNAPLRTYYGYDKKR